MNLTECVNSLFTNNEIHLAENKLEIMNLTECENSLFTNNESHLADCKFII